MALSFEEEYMKVQVIKTFWDDDIRGRVGDKMEISEDLYDRAPQLFKVIQRRAKTVVKTAVKRKK